ncbi:MAG: hypothetical protein NUV65_01780 [Candidatus Roizmanbacteria bacterium]|nr:hypothetical protein [Candidatus Roizmanbacteria bacterium]
MDSEPQIIPDNRVEERKIHVLLERYREDLGGFDMVPVGNAGYILQRQSHIPMAGNDWAMFDYDDTLTAYTEAKIKRQELYMQYLRNSGIVITDTQAAHAMHITDEFSRWEERINEGKLYHIGAHIATLHWVTKGLKNSTDSAEITLTRIQDHLNRIKSTYTNVSAAEEDDPFYFRESDKKFILRSKNTIWPKPFGDIFQKTTITPPQYNEMVAAAADIGTPRDSIHRTNVNIFSKGEPHFQLAKILELLKQNPDLPVSQIWLSNTQKGDFIIEAVETNATAQLEQEYIPQNMLEDSDEGPSYGSGYILSQYPHTIVMFDDNPKELLSIVSTRKYLREHTGASFIAVRSIRKGTREQSKEWHVQTQYGNVDFTARSYAPREISNIFLLNRYLAIKARLGPTHPNTEKSKKELLLRGIIIPE